MSAAEPAEALAGSASAPLPAATVAAVTPPAESGSAEKPYTLYAGNPCVPVVCTIPCFLAHRATSCKFPEPPSIIAGVGVNPSEV